MQHRDVDAIPTMVREAHARLAFEGGVLALVEVERGPKTKALRITVHERGTRRDGHVEFDAEGHVVAASPE